jgi:membrane-associated protein
MSTLLDITLLQGGFVQRFIEWIINNGGLYVLLIVVFAETGVFIGLFFKGENILLEEGIDIRDI